MEKLYEEDLEHLDRKVNSTWTRLTQGICDVCWNNLELDGSCITCRLEKRVRELEKELSELRDAIKSDQEENPDEIHCSCVPLLKVRIKELEHVEEFATKNIFFLQKKLDEAKVRIKKLEDEITSKPPEERELCRGCTLPKSVKELKEGIKRYLLSYPLVSIEELCKLVEEKDTPGL